MPIWRVTNVCGHTTDMPILGSPDRQRSIAARRRVGPCAACFATDEPVLVITHPSSRPVCHPHDAKHRGRSTRRRRS